MKLFRFIFIVFILLQLGCSSQGKTAKKANLYLQLGTAHLQNQNYPAALKDLQTAYELDSENSVICNNLGLAYFVRDRFKEAADYFKKAISLNPQYTEAKSNLGRTYAELKEFEKSLKILSEASQDLTYDAPQKILMNKGYTYFLMKKYDFARQEFEKSLRIDDKNCLLSNYFGQTLFFLNEYQLSLQAFNQTIDRCGTNQLEDPYYYSAVNYYKLGLFAQAKSQIRSLEKFFPQGRWISKAKDLLPLME